MHINTQQLQDHFYRAGHVGSGQNILRSDITRKPCCWDKTWDNFQTILYQNVSFFNLHFLT